VAAPHPRTFTLTEAEAAAIQSMQLARQTGIARKGPMLRYTSLAAPVIAAVIIWAVDLLWYDGAMSMSLFVTLLAVFVGGMMFQTAGYWLNLQAARKRMLHTTQQVFEPRTVRFVPEGIEVSIPTAATLQKWPGVKDIEMKNGMILVWAGNLLPVSVPLRAFSSEEEAETFLAECRRQMAEAAD